MAAQSQRPLTYKEKYEQDEDVLNGQYASLYTRFAANSGYPAIDIQQHVIASSNVVPKVFLFLTEKDGGPVVATLHRPTRYEAHPVTTSSWDGKAFAFIDDLLPGNYIQMVEFPTNAFALCPEQVTPTLAGIDAQLATLAPEEPYYR